MIKNGKYWRVYASCSVWQVNSLENLNNAKSHNNGMYNCRKWNNENTNWVIPLQKGKLTKKSIAASSFSEHSATFNRFLRNFKESVASSSFVPVESFSEIANWRCFVPLRPVRTRPHHWARADTRSDCRFAAHAACNWGWCRCATRARQAMKSRPATIIRLKEKLQFRIVAPRHGFSTQKGRISKWISERARCQPGQQKGIQGKWEFLFSVRHLYLSRWVAVEIKVWRFFLWLFAALLLEVVLCWRWWRLSKAHICY